jgi:hypothetical protein
MPVAKEVDAYGRKGVNGDGLETDQVWARWNGRRDGRSPGRVLVDHLAGSPLAIVHSAGKKARLVNLEPREAGS